MRWSTGTLLLCGLGAMTVLAAPAEIVGEPAEFRVDAQHDGFYQAAGVPVLHGVKWKFQTDGAVISTPAVSGGTVYFGSSDHNLYALDGASGALRWKFATKGRITSSPAVTGGRVYFGSYDSNF